MWVRSKNLTYKFPRIMIIISICVSSKCLLYSFHIRQIALLFPPFCYTLVKVFTHSHIPLRFYLRDLQCLCQFCFFSLFLFIFKYFSIHIWRNLLPSITFNNVLYIYFYFNEKQILKSIALDNSFGKLNIGHMCEKFNQTTLMSRNKKIHVL